MEKHTRMMTVSQTDHSHSPAAATSIPEIPLRWLEHPVWLIVALGIVIVVEILLGLDTPFVHYHDYDSVLLGSHARHFAEFGYARFGLQNVSLIDASGQIFYYSRRPPFVTILLSLLYRMVGATVVSTRLFALFEGLCMLAAFYALIAHVAGRRMAGLSTLIFAIWPGHLSFNARHTTWEALGVALALATMLAYLRWFEERRARWCVLAVAFIVMGAWSAWEYYSAIPIILLHWWRYEPRSLAPRKLVRLIPFVLVPVLMLGLHYVLSTTRPGIGTDYDLSLAQAFRERILGEGNLIRDYLLVAHVFAVQSYYHFGIPAVLLALGGTAASIRVMWRQRRVTSREFWLFGLMIYSVLHFVIVRTVLPGHDFMMMLVMPFMALAAALGAAWLFQFAHRRRWLGAALAIVIAGIGGWSYHQTAVYDSEGFAIPGHMRSLEANLDDVLFIRDLLKPGESALAAFRLSRLPHFYLSPESKFATECVVTLKQLQEALSTSDRHAYYIMHRDQLPQGGIDLDLPPQVYPCEGGDVVDPSVLAYLDQQGYTSYEQGIYRIVVLSQK
jgi:4-amino-4-deoxy-L-arabinose transferase-like glycosyltransferase